MIRLLAGLFLGLAPGLLSAATGEAQLRAFLATTTTLSAEFVQQRSADTGTERASGRLQLARPGRFRWDYREPYRQLLLADGERLWIYDPDLEQVTVKRQDDALGRSPARLLSGELDLDGHFRIVDLGSRAGLDWVELHPSGEDEGEFSSVQLGFTGGALAAMRMLDNLGTTTDITFSDVAVNLELDPGTFSFTPPPGVDVLGE